MILWPVLLYDKLIDAYVDNPSYITLSDDSSDISKKWYNNIKNVLCRIDKKLLPRYVKKKINHHIPYGYIIPKNKDVLKDRPVVAKVAGIRYVDDIVILGSYDDDNITDHHRNIFCCSTKRKN